MNLVFLGFLNNRRITETEINSRNMLVSKRLFAGAFSSAHDSIETIICEVPRGSKL